MVNIVSLTMMVKGRLQSDTAMDAPLLEWNVYGMKTTIIKFSLIQVHNGYTIGFSLA